MYTAICVARSVSNGFKLEFFFGKNDIDALRRALFSRSAKSESDFLDAPKSADKTVPQTVDSLAAILDASMGVGEQWGSANDTKGAIHKALFLQPIVSVH